MSWGKALGDKVQAVRSPEVGVINGLQITLPSPEKGGLEVIIGVEDKCLPKLLHDPLWNKYASSVV